ncbi:MAG: ATP-dependent helicase HrpA, partial [Nocardioidaceae bacterium]|nr:ATP-dependent helicase HrpA [Nocardioidaceae bacterium]
GVARTGATTWVFGSIEESFTQVRAGHEVQGYPALDDEGESVGLRVVGSAEEPEARHRLGVRRLLRLQVPSPAKTLLDAMDNTTKLGLAGSPYPTVAALVEDCVLTALGDLVDAGETVRDEAAYDALLARARSEVASRTGDVLVRVGEVLARWRAVQKLLGGRVELPLLPAMSDLGAQLERLVHVGFVAESGSAALTHLPRYLAAMEERVGRLAAETARDRQLMDQVGDLQLAWQHRVDALPADRPLGRSLRDVRWQLEELRVSLWAQRLGTSQPVSDTRIRRALG